LFAGDRTKAPSDISTTISPYLFFWQASQQVEEVQANHQRKPLLRASRQALDAFSRSRADTLTGMAISNIIALAIIFATAATLNKAGITSIETSAQAAEALRPIAGNFAFAVFALHRRHRSFGSTDLGRFGGLRDRRSTAMAGGAWAPAERSCCVLFDLGGCDRPRRSDHTTASLGNCIPYMGGSKKVRVAESHRNRS
jgi:uncharacterized membrane protein YgcG